MKTYGDLLNALISHYEKCIEELPEGEDEIYLFLFQNKIYFGICHCSAIKFKFRLYQTIFIKEFTHGKAYLEKAPIEYKCDAKELLQIRVDRMKELFPKWENVEL